jgi:uncharacterized protein (DUF433 family)
VTTVAQNILEIVLTIPEVECVPGRCGGRPTFTDSRLTVETIVWMIEANVPDDEILDGYPRLTPELLNAVRAFVSKFG